MRIPLLDPRERQRRALDERQAASNANPGIEPVPSVSYYLIESRHSAVCEGRMPYGRRKAIIRCGGAQREGYWQFQFRNQQPETNLRVNHRDIVV